MLTEKEDKYDGIKLFTLARKTFLESNIVIAPTKAN
jgi:hypothetical protein